MTLADKPVPRRDAYKSLLKSLALITAIPVLPNSALGVVPPVEIAMKPLLPAAHTHAAMTTNSFTLVPDATFIYRTGFEAATWSGSLRKIVVSVAPGDGSVQIASLAEWDAADLLSGTNGQPPATLPEERHIFTSHFDAASRLQTVPFRWDSLSNSQRALLDLSPATNVVDRNGARRVQFLRGVRSDETGQVNGIFRKRVSVLGDIVNSAPVYVGAPSAGIGGADYQKFYNAQKNRRAAVYVGANDGLLHAFDADNGSELFAYIPDSLISRLNLLSDPDYAHRPYVDGGIAVAEATVRGEWKTVLVAGMGGGAQGVFALDVSDPANFVGGAGALWEFTDRDEPDMGNVFNAPVVAKFKVKLVKGVPEYRYFAAVASGLNNYVNDGNSNSKAPAVLFLLALDKNPDEKWILGVNYFKLKKTIANRNAANGLSAPALVVGEDGAVRYGYAGDLQGNLWRFDFTGVQPWVKENKATTPLFIAQNGRQDRQAITVQPKVVFAPGGYVVLFGTGKFLEQSDLDQRGFKLQTFYGIYDKAKSSYTVQGRNELESRTATKTDQDGYLITGQDFSYGDGPGYKKGWYFDFPESDSTGERSVNNPVTAAGRVLFNTLIPCVKLCPQGIGRSYMVSALTGRSGSNNETGTLATAGMVASPVVLDVGTRLGRRNPMGRAVATRRSVVINPGAKANQEPAATGQGSEQGIITTSAPARRYSWREILNWQELKYAATKK